MTTQSLFEPGDEFLTCQECGKKDETVHIRNCGYAADVHNNPNYSECVCDACEHEHLMDI